MITIDLAETIFVGCLLIGGGLLLLTILLDDILGGVLDFLHLDLNLGGVSLMPILLGFVSMFGVGGLIGTRVFDLGPGGASLVGVTAGALGGGLVAFIFNFLKRAEAPDAFGLRDLVGQKGRVVVGIRAGLSGSVDVSFAGGLHNVSATAETDIPPGTTVLVRDLAASTLIVTPLVATASGQTAADAATEREGRNA